MSKAKEDFISEEMIAEMEEQEAKKPEPKPEPQKAMEEVVVVKEDSKAPESPEKKKTIGVDISPEEVVSLDQQGYDLYFESSPGNFRELDMESFSDLSRKNRNRYLASKQLWEKELREQEDIPAKLRYTGRLASATARLKVTGMRKGMEPAWVAPRDVQDRMSEGYKFCTDPNVKTFMKPDEDGLRRVTALGNDELVLMEAPKELRDARRKQFSEKSKRQKGGVIQRARDSVAGLGMGKTFDPGELRDNPNYRFTPTRNKEE